MGVVHSAAVPGCETECASQLEAQGLAMAATLLTCPLPPPPPPVSLQEKAQGRNAHYKLTSTVMLWLQTIKAGSGTMNLGGSLTRQSEADFPVNDASPHIANIGRMVEVGVGGRVPTLAAFHWPDGRGGCGGQSADSGCSS